MRIDLALVVTLVTVVGSAAASAATITNSMTIDAANSYPAENVLVRDGTIPPTEVDIVFGGSIGGNLAVGDWQHNVDDTATVNLIGGSVEGSVTAYCHSTVTMSWGSVGGHLASKYRSSVVISGGTITDFVQAEDSSTIDPDYSPTA